MNDFYRSTIESQRREISHLRTEQTSSNKRLKAYWIVGLAGWVLAVGALIWPVNAKASERHTATVVRCQQASDTCIKHESVFPDAEACEAANRQAICAKHYSLKSRASAAEGENWCASWRDGYEASFYLVCRSCQTIEPKPCPKPEPTDSSGYMRGVKDGAADGKQKQKEWI